MDIGDVRNTAIWFDPWVPHMDTFLLPRPLQYPVGVQMVANLIDYDTFDWIMDFCLFYFLHNKC